MKKLALVIAAALISVAAFAQKGEKAIGARFLYGSEIEKIGIGILGQYGFEDEIRGELGFNFYPDDNANVFEVNANAQYLLGNDSVTFYPFAGLNLTSIKHASTKPGINIGAGIEFPLTDVLNFAAEVKYVISKYDQFILGAGINFKF